MFGISDDKNVDNNAASDPYAADAPADNSIMTDAPVSAAPTVAYDETAVEPAPAAPLPPTLVPTAPPVPTPPPAISDAIASHPPHIDPPPVIPTPDPVLPAIAPKLDEKLSASALMGGSSDDQLLKMKQQALQSLAPLIDHLEQTPEEKFKTTMMLIQASDNADLVKEAYEAANAIKDDKVRAQALLDVVNEINYFTHKKDGVEA